MNPQRSKIWHAIGSACAGILLSGGFSPAQAELTDANRFLFSSDWPMYSYDYANTNNNPVEYKISPRTASTLKRAWSTFNDSALVTTPPPTGFLFESVLGLKFPSSVVGVVAPPVIKDGVIYYIDELGTLFARDARTGKIADTRRHWTTHLVDPDYAQATDKIVPELYYTALAVTDTHVWVLSAVNGRLHAIKRDLGAEVDFNTATPEVDPYKLVSDQLFASSFGDPVIIKTTAAQGNRVLLVSGTAVIVNDVLAGNKNTGLMVAVDITDPAHPFEKWRTPTIDINPATGKPYGSGVSAGSGLAVDLKRGVIYAGTGQNTSVPYVGYPDPNLAPKGYIDRGDALWALNYMTGAIVWVNQFHNNDVFDLNHPVSAGPGRTDGPRDADVLAPPTLFSADIPDRYGVPRRRDLVGDGSKGGLFRVADRDTGATVWERQISKPTGLGGIQGGSAYAAGNVYIAGFEGVEDGFSDAQFDAPGSKYLNAFFATFSPAFWADVEDLRVDGNVATGMQVKLYKLDAATGKSKWRFADGKDYVALPGANMRHVSVANRLVYVTTTAGQLFVIETETGRIVYKDQTLDLNAYFNLGLNKPHHAPMNAGTLISNGMVYVPYGGQNNPSGGIIAYKPLIEDWPY
ncbi:MAG: hypothetical protein EOP38_19300 [Rubrivivax sp.]|nr:MAG: hypothetical protein EOP38_19300 [Rubrivivax sp.]